MGSGFILWAADGQPLPKEDTALGPGSGRLLAKGEGWLRKGSVIWQEMRDVYTAYRMIVVPAEPLL